MLKRVIYFILIPGILTWTGVLSAQDVVPGTGDADKAVTESEKKVDDAKKAVEAQPSAGNENGDTTPKTNNGTTTTGTTTGTTNTAGTTQPASNTTGQTTGAGIYNDGKTLYATSKTRFALDAQDELSTLKSTEYKIDDSPYQSYKDPIRIEAEGSHRIVYRSIDQAGNIESEKVYLIIIDNTAPAVSVSSSNQLQEKDGFIYAIGGTKLEVKASDAYCGVKTIEYSINDAAWQAYGQPIVLDQPGDLVLKYRALDYLGNQTPDQIFRVKVDKSAPVVSIDPKSPLVPLNDKKYAMRDNVYSINAKDDTSGVAKIEVKIDGESEFKQYATPITFTVEGAHTIETRAVDLVGNTSEVVKLDVLVDDNPPQTTIRTVE